MDKKKKKYNTFVDYLKTTISGLVFIIVISLGIWATSLTILPDPGLDPVAFWGEFIKRAILTIMLVSSGVSFMYDITKMIIIGIGTRSHAKGTAVQTPGYRYIEAQSGIQLAKEKINKHGLIMELEETVDFINYERRADGYEDIIDRNIYKLGKKLQKKKIARVPEKALEVKKELTEEKSRKITIAKFRKAITVFDRNTAIDRDEELARVYGEPRHDIVYTKDIFNMKKNNMSIFEKITNSAPMLFFKDRIKPIVTPLIFAALTTYYLIEFLSSSNATALLITVGITTLIAMGKAGIAEMTTRFTRLYTEPLEDNNYIFNKFLSKNKTLIQVLDDGEMSIDEYHDLRKHKMETLKEQLTKQMAPVEEIKNDE